MSDLWNALFSFSESNRMTLEFRELRKGGRPFLLLPRQIKPAAVTLDLYPAQSFRARAAKFLLRLFVKTGFPIGFGRTSLSVASDDEFLKFLSVQSGTTSQIPEFGILAGNPAHDTQRFIIVLFDQNQRPVAVAKAGTSGPANALIEKEQQFLSNVPLNTVGIPRVLSSFASPRVKSFAMDFIQGESPRDGGLQHLPSILSSWISARQIALCETPAWQQLEGSSWLFPVYPALRQLRDRKIRATIQHGDFTPWNIKVLKNGTWTVLDWERGTLNGIPGWDWFHYIIQSAVLVGHKTPDEIAKKLDAVLESQTFKNYAEKSHIAGLDGFGSEQSAGFQRELVIAYLAHLIDVIKPAEGIETNRDLLATLARRWFNHWPSVSSVIRKRAG